MIQGFSGGPLTTQEWQLRIPHCWIDEILDTLTNQSHSGFLKQQIEADEHTESHSKIRVECHNLRFHGGSNARLIKKVEFAVAFGWKILEIKKLPSE